ncbi:MAG: ABC transporter substrate-binding protein [Syntrophobacterales bacterium]|jgi:peptide/nickel transport system substrate-binding protein/oligopeptide transport system substrate-binding protein
MRRLLLLLTVLLTLLNGCQQEPSETIEKPQPEVKAGGVYHAALPWSPRSLDPPFTTDIYSVTLIQQIFDGLVQFDQKLNVRPALAINWRVSSDGLVYTFTLRQDARFHNGRQVTADDFIYSFTRILEPKKQAGIISFLEKIKGATKYRRGKSKEVEGLRALDPHTLEITLQEPFAPFLSVLAMKDSKVVPKEEVERWGEDYSHHPMGTGPFRLESWEGNRIVLSANPDYHEGPPHLDRVVYTIYAGAQRQKILQEFLANRLDEAAVFGADREEMAQTTVYQFVRKPGLSLQFYGMNCTSAPLKDKRVRQALGWAINKEEIIREVFKDQFIPAETILPPGMTGYTPVNAAYGYDPERAKELLAKAGYGPLQKKLSLTLLSASKSNVAQKELAMVAAYLAAVGVELQIKYETDWPTFEATLNSGRFQLYRYFWSADIPDPDNFLNVLCGSDSLYNFMHYSNPKVDRLLSQALVETDIIERVRLYREAESMILEDAPMIPFMYWVFESVFQPYVKGLEISALGSPYMPLKRIWLDKK